MSTDVLKSEPRTVTGWVQYFDAYFARPNKSSGRGPRDLQEFTDRLAELGGYITSSKHQRGAVWYKYYAKYFAWICGLSVRAEIDLAKAVWMRFPNKCCKCGKTPCAFVFNPAIRVHDAGDSAAIRAEAEAQYGSDVGLRSRGLQDWFHSLTRIWPTNLHKSLGDIVERFHEEQSELIKDVRFGQEEVLSAGFLSPGQRSKIEDELADLVSWYLAIGAAVLLTIRPENPYVHHQSATHELTIDFDRLILDQYIRGCDNCGKKPCACERTAPVDRSDLAIAAAVSSPAQVAQKNDVVDWLVNTGSVDLGAYRAVGDFICVDDGLRAKLMTVVDEVKKKLDGIRCPYPVLLCAKPGSGKTFLVTQVANALGISKQSIIADNLAPADDIADVIRAHTTRIATAQTTPRVAFLDEVDTAVGADTAYRYLLPALEGSPIDFLPGVRNPLPGVVWFFAGSKAATEKGMEAFLAKQEKGLDFLRRFRQSGAVIELAGPSDPVQIAIQALAGLKSEVPTVRAVDARIVLLFAGELWGDAGEIAAEIRRIGVAKKGAELIGFDSLAASPRLFARIPAEGERIARLGERMIHLVG